MLLILRKLLFYILVLTYLVLTPYVILYALGYTFNPTREGDFFSKTGLLSVVTEPHGATVLVEGKRFSRKTPTAVRGLLEGKYMVQVQKKGFETWRKEVEITSQRATRLEPVLLVPYRQEEELISSDSFIRMVPGLQDFKIFGWTRPTLMGLTGFDIFLKREFEMGEKIPGSDSIKVQDLTTKPGSSFVVMKAEQKGDRKFFVLDLTREKSFRDVTALLPEKPDILDWDVKSAELVYGLEDGKVFAFDWRKGAYYPEVANGVIGLGVKHDRLYLLNKDLTLSVIQKKETQEALPFEDRDLESFRKNIHSGKYYRIEIFKRDIFRKDLLFFLSDKGELLMNYEPFLIAESGVRGFQYSTHPEQEKIVFWTSKELKVMVFPKGGETGIQAPEFSTITGKAENIRQAFWGYEDSHVIFLDGDRVFLAEAQPPQPYLVRELFRVAQGSEIFYTEMGHYVYYLRPSDRALVRRKIVE